MSEDKSPVQQVQEEAMRSTIAEVLRTVFDPEVPVNIYDMGLIYDLDVSERAG